MRSDNTCDAIQISALAALAADPEVVYISPERQLFRTFAGSPTAALDYHIETVGGER
jgi:hypothetical protein